MNLFRKLALAGVGFAFVLGLAATETNAQRSGRYYGNGGNGRSYVYTQSRNGGRGYGNGYGRYYGSSRYGRSYNSYNSGRYGLSWRERRALAFRRARMIRATNRYYRTRSRIMNRRSSGYGRVYYRNY